MDKIKIGIVGIGNCASSLIQGIDYYGNTDEDIAIGLMHWEIGGYHPFDIEVVSAFDVDARKVGRDVAEAVFAPPNCTTVFCDELAKNGTTVRMGQVLDGFSDHMSNYDDKCTFVLADEPEPSMEEVVKVLKESGTEVLLNYVPVVRRGPPSSMLNAPCRRASLSSITCPCSSPVIPSGLSGSRRRPCRS